MRDGDGTGEWQGGGGAGDGDGEAGGLTAFLMAVIVATVNAVIIGCLMCLSAVGAFLAMFCTSLTFIYIGALAATSFAIGSAVFMASCVVLFFSGLHLYLQYYFE